MFDTGVLEEKRGSVRLIHPDAWGLSRQTTLAARQYLAAVERALAHVGAACVHRDEVGVTCLNGRGLRTVCISARTW
ncbi:hypothetical protein Q0M94_17905 (plasmid) [Deinococcus radiomollis]|uniref:hypothetical protein n=1 Tax=Deinococcus radiomollis TaxID=468916 RepID=UPI0038923AD0